MPAKNFTMPTRLAPLWVTLAEAKELLGVSHSTVYALVREKQIKADKYQGRAIFSKKSIERYLSTWTQEEKRLHAAGSR